MRRILDRTNRSLCALAAALLGIGPVAAQEIGELPELGGRRDDAAQELIELFHQVERNLERIDVQLADAGAGELPLEAVEDSGLEDLLRDSQKQSRDVESAIARILEIAQEMGKGQGAPGGGSPLDQQRGEGPQGKERTPDAPQQPGDPQDAPSEPEKDESPNPKAGENQSGEPPQREPGDPRRPGVDADEWGFLPDRLRDVFRNQGGDDMPVRYRTWIDSYYRRLNRVER